MDAQRRVLLVEDDPDDAALVRRALRGAPFAVVWRERLVLALERLNAGGLDVILCDLHLPDSRGLETVQRLKAQARGVPIVVLTGSAGTEDGIEAVRAGAQDYLSKDELVGPHLARTLAFACERQEIERFKEELVRMVAHELRSPAATAVSCLDLLRGTCSGSLSPEAREVLEKADQSLSHLLAVLDDLAEAHRAGMGRLSVELRDVDAGALLRDAAESLAAGARDKGIALRVEGPAVGAVRADPGRLRQVLTNLVDNALKFTEPGGSVTLAVHPQTRTDCARFSVIDTGPGIPSEQAARVFDKLYQTPLGRKAGGLGLGLYIAREFVQRQGGMIWVESRPGVGTAFHFTLPLAVPSGGVRQGLDAERLL